MQAFQGLCFVNGADQRIVGAKIRIHDQLRAGTQKFL